MSFTELFSPLGKVKKLFGKFFGNSRDGAVLLDVAQDKFFKLHRVYVNDLGVAKLQIKNVSMLQSVSLIEVRVIFESILTTFIASVLL
jgi:hypothetical protein